MQSKNTSTRVFLLSLLGVRKGRGVPAGDAAWQTGGGGEILHWSRKLLLGPTRLRSDTTTTTSTSAGVQAACRPRRAGAAFTEATEQMWRELRWKTTAGRPFFLFLHAKNEGAEWLRYALLGGLSVPQRAHWGAVHQGGIPEAKAGGLHQPVQERHAWALRLRQRHWVL